MQDVKPLLLHQGFGVFDQLAHGLPVVGQVVIGVLQAIGNIAGLTGVDDLFDECDVDLLAAVLDGAYTAGAHFVALAAA